MDIPGFDPSTMTYLATQMAHPNVSSAGGGNNHGGKNGGDPFQEMLLPMEMQDHQSTYGGYAASEDMTLHGMQPPKRFSSMYEDPFSDVVSAFDNPINHEPQDPETPSIDRDNKLLSFSMPSFDYTLLDYTYRRTSISLSAQLHGMFFLAESPWAAGDAQAAPNELTCYRRNLFQITGEITLPRGLRYIMTEQGEQIPIIGQELVIGATESTEGNPVKIISVPWKTPVNPSVPVVEDKVEREPPSIPLDLMTVQDLNTEYASFPFQWKRLQFRIATANNGRRKELQQHFLVRLKVLATLATGGKIPICEVHSGAIIVRGRSPRNFQSRKDMPLNGSGHIRKNTNGPGHASRTSTGDATKPKTAENQSSAPIKTEAAVANSTASFFDPSEAPGANINENYDWTAGGADAIRSSPPDGVGVAVGAGGGGGAGAGGHAYPMSSPDVARKSASASAPPSKPINLSLVEDDSPRTGSNQSPPDARSVKKLHIPARPPSFTLNTINSPDESADLLYEYFPLGLDDWMPPVDAVYRPHVVHHTKLPTDPRDPKTSAKGSRSKRYFSEDVS